VSDSGKALATSVPRRRADLMGLIRLRKRVWVHQQGEGSCAKAVQTKTPGTFSVPGVWIGVTRAQPLRNWVASLVGFFSSHFLMRWASATRVSLPHESSSTITTGWLAIIACITRHRPDSLM
jgi:hypothetical protein